MICDGEGEVRKFLLGIAFGALALPAAAADMPVKVPPPAPVDIWTGGYVGANVGYDWGRDYIDSTGSPGNCDFNDVGSGCSLAPVNYISTIGAQAATFQTRLDHSGVIYGGQAGHNWLVNNMFWNYNGVLGVEVDFQGKSDSHSVTVSNYTAMPLAPLNSLSQTATFSQKIETLGTLRGRAGVLWGPSTLIYATAGLAWANVQQTASYTQFVNGPLIGIPGPGNNVGGVNQEVFGGVIGGGIEWKWTPNLSIKAEYLYADLGHVTMNTGAIQPTVGGFIFGTTQAHTETHVNDNIARVGINYKFW
jgi:outer membrane immunogenic protein